MNKESIDKMAEEYASSLGWESGLAEHYDITQGFITGYTKALENGVRWQLCPKCNGQGIVSKPPWIPEGVNQWSSTEASFVCNVCNGSKILPSPPIK